MSAYIVTHGCDPDLVHEVVATAVARSAIGKIMVKFRGRVRQWRDDKPGGLAVVDIPAELVAALGGRRQMRVTGSIEGASFTGSTMLVAGGGFCVGVSRAALKAANASVGDDVELELEPARK